MTRVGIVPPAVTITADDKRLKAGKPAPDPFLLAAKELGYDAARCVVFEDSPSGIRAGVASGATVIATSSSDEKLEVAKRLGAAHVINYKKTPDWDKEALRLTGGRGVDHVVEVGGSGTIMKSVNCTRFGGSIGLIGFVAGVSLGAVSGKGRN